MSANGTSSSCDGLPTFDHTVPWPAMFYGCHPQRAKEIKLMLEEYGGSRDASTVKLMLEQEGHRKSRCMEGRKGVWSNISRTHVREVSYLLLHSVCLQSTLDLVCLLEALGVTSDTLWVYQVSLKDSSGLAASDEGALRGGFTAKERQQVNKVSIGITAYREIPGYNKKTVKAVMEERILKRPRLKDSMRGATLILDAHGATVALVFHNFLGDKEVLSRKRLVSLCEEGSFLGWCKSCGLSGITNTLKLWQWISSRIDVRTAYFGRTEASYIVLNILANGKKKGACNSHKLLTTF
jgi:hypothetical protein